MKGADMKDFLFNASLIFCFIGIAAIELYFSLASSTEHSYRQNSILLLLVIIITIVLVISTEDNGKGGTA